MQLIEVNNKKSVDDFHRFAEQLYRADNNWTPQLRLMIENTFNPGKNAKFEIGGAARWLVYKNGKCAGRIAAFYEKNYIVGDSQPTGGFGFFECINDTEVAFLLFDTAKNWLLNNGLEAMDGPINFGENFFNWGLLADGFKPQTFGMQYHPPYYRDLLEAYGFQTYYEQYSYELDISTPDLPDRFWKIAEWVTKKPGYTFEHFSFAKQDKYISDFLEIHRQAWSGHSNYRPARKEQLKDMLRDSKILIDEEFIWFAYHNGAPIGFFMMIPDLNQIIRKLKTGRLNWLNVVKLHYYKHTKTITQGRVLVMGVVPKFQNRGIESAIFLQLKTVMLKRNWYKSIEMSWVGDFNPKMNALFKSFGAQQTLTHLTMRYLFDRYKPFSKAPVME